MAEAKVPWEELAAMGARLQATEAAMEALASAARQARLDERRRALATQQAWLLVQSQASQR